VAAYTRDRVHTPRESLELVHVVVLKRLNRLQPAACTVLERIVGRLVAEYENGGAQ
jgi:hypothetical protein